MIAGDHQITGTQRLDSFLAIRRIDQRAQAETKRRIGLIVIPTVIPAVAGILEEIFPLGAAAGIGKRAAGKKGERPGYRIVTLTARSG